MSDGTADGLDRVYPHGYIVSLEVCLTASEYVRFMDTNRVRDRRRWKDRTEKRRKDKSVVRLHRAGSVSLTGRAPRNANLGLSKLNREWGTHIYGIVIEEQSEAMFGDDCERFRLVIYGVRSTDIEVVARRLGLKQHHWAISGWEQVEQYIVISGPDAWGASTALSGAYRRASRGPRTRKEMLLEDYSLPVPIASRATATALVSVYKIHLGATATWKMEAVLRSDRHRHLLLGPEATVAVKKALFRLAAQLRLTLLAKPARWEPFLVSDLEYHGPGLGGLWGKTYRGSKPGVSPTHDLRGMEGVRLVESTGPSYAVGAVDVRAGVSDPQASIPEGEHPSPSTTMDSHTLLTKTEVAGVLVNIVGQSILDARVNDCDMEDSLLDAFIVGGGVCDPAVGPYSSLSPRLFPYGDSIDILNGGPSAGFLVAENLSLRNILLSSSRPNPEPALVPSTATSWSVKIAKDIEELPEGWLVEVIIDADLGAGPVVRGLSQVFGCKMNLRCLGIPALLSPFSALGGLMLSGLHGSVDADVLVFVIDETVDPRFANMFLEDIHTVLEVAGHDLKVVLVSSLHGGFWRTNDRNELNMDSTVAGAKFHANTRYRVDIDHLGRVETVYLVKDERHGRSGRRLWHRWGAWQPTPDSNLDDLFEFDLQPVPTAADAIIEFDLDL